MKYEEYSDYDLRNLAKELDTYPATPSYVYTEENLDLTKSGALYNILISICNNLLVKNITPGYILHLPQCIYMQCLRNLDQITGKSEMELIIKMRYFEKTFTEIGINKYIEDDVIYLSKIEFFPFRKTIIKIKNLKTNVFKEEPYYICPKCKSVEIEHDWDFYPHAQFPIHCLNCDHRFEDPKIVTRMKN